MKLTPMADRVLLKACETEETTQSGIILSTATKEKPVVSVVVAVGPGGVVDGNEVVMTVKPGDKVVIAKYAGTELKLDGEEYSIVKQSDILAVVTD
jgi:chaperonin GroES